MRKKTEAPLFHISKRKALPWYGRWAIRGGAILLAMVVCAIVTTLLTGENPLAVYATMFEGAFGTERRIWILLQNTAILLCISLAVTPAFKMRFWNIGAEGQVLMGCLANAACLILLGDKIPNWLLILITVIASCAAGAIWAAIPAIFKAKWNTNETLFTLMMNYVAIQLTSFCVALWENPFGSNSVGIINQNTMAGWFPAVFGQTYMLNVILAVIVTVGVYLYMKKMESNIQMMKEGKKENYLR